MRRLLLDMIYYVVVQPEGDRIININTIVARGWRMASFLFGIPDGLDILQHSPLTYSMGKWMVADISAA